MPKKQTETFTVCGRVEGRENMMIKVQATTFDDVRRKARQQIRTMEGQRTAPVYFEFIIRNNLQMVDDPHADGFEVEDLMPDLLHEIEERIPAVMAKMFETGLLKDKTDADGDLLMRIAVRRLAADLPMSTADLKLEKNLYGAVKA